VPPALNADRALALQVVERVRAHGQVSRVELARTLQVSPGSITPAVAELLEAGILAERAAQRSADTQQGRGRPPVALSIQPDFGLVVGMKLSDTSHTAVLMDFAGVQVAQARSDRGSIGLTGEDLVAEVRALFAKLLEAAGARADDVRALGLGVPGFVEAQTGNLLWSPLLATGPLDLQTQVAQELGVECIVDNDANVLTMAELWFGAGRQMADFAVITIEHGVGMGWCWATVSFAARGGLAPS